jgi:hypothetical protein
VVYHLLSYDPDYAGLESDFAKVLTSAAHGETTQRVTLSSTRDKHGGMDDVKVKEGAAAKSQPPCQSCLNQSRSAAGISAPERVCMPREFSRRRQRRPAAIQLYARDDALLRPHAARRGARDRAPARVIPGGVLATTRLCEGRMALRTTARHCEHFTRSTFLQWPRGKKRRPS